MTKLGNKYLLINSVILIFTNLFFTIEMICLC